MSLWVSFGRLLLCLYAKEGPLNVVNISFCLCFLDYATLTILFLYNNVQQRLSLKLPLTINKFFEPTEMNSEAFFSRWKNLSG